MTDATITIPDGSPLTAGAIQALVDGDALIRPDMLARVAQPGGGDSFAVVITGHRPDPTGRDDFDADTVLSTIESAAVQTLNDADWTDEDLHYDHKVINTSAGGGDGNDFADPEE